MASYVTRAEFLAYAVPKGGTDAADDAVIDALLTRVSAYIDEQTGRVFAGQLATKYYDAPDGRVVYFGDDDLLTVTSITNGDGTAVTAADYQLMPINGTPKYAVRLKQSSSLYWTADSNGNTEGVIAVVGTWGWSAAPPEDIKQAVLMIASNLYKGRTGETASGAATVTGAGVVITPKDIPAVAQSIINFYKRLM